jgi:S-DNA-T family DNA segregation ATPase FtsK/SpoIIIE
LPGGTPKPIRLQNAFISTEEIENIINFISSQKGFSKKYYLPKIEEERADDIANLIDDLDPMFEEAAKIIVETQQASTSFLQRKLKLGYSRAARIMDELETTGIIGNTEGGRGRVPLVKNVDELDILLRNYGL